jgi:hypothetical protein
MRVWHAGFIVAGAAVAGGLAVRLAEVPPSPREVAAARLAPEVADPVVVPAVRAPVPWKAAPPEEPVASAPPTVYSEPPPVSPPPSSRRKPFPVATASAVPAVAKSVPNKTISNPMVVPPPVPYQEPPHQESPHHEQPAPSRHVTLEPGMSIAVRIQEGVLAEPLVAGGLEIAERGAKVIMRPEDGDRFRLLSFQSADGQRVEVSTEPANAGGGVVRFRLAARITITERKL